MPLYEYECAKCGRFEKIEKFSDKPLKSCPTCKGRKIERLLSAPAIQFKGSGWYVTDYARKGDGAKDKAGDKKGEPAVSSGDSSEKSTPKKTTSDKKAASSGTPTKS